MRGLRNPRRKLVYRSLQPRGDSSVGNCNHHVDLRSVALGTKGTTVLDRRPALLARVLHSLKLAHNEPGEQDDIG